MAQASIELSCCDRRSPINDPETEDAHALRGSFEPQAPDATVSLPPADTGRQAWLFLAACWGVEALTFGFGLSFGVFQDYYSHHAPFAGSGNTAVIGTTTMALMYIGTPFVVLICRLFPRQARWFSLGGLIMASASMALSSFCTSVPQLIGAQGVLYGLGGCIAYCPCTLYIDEWFARRKGLAYGIVWSAAGVGGAALPLALEALLKNMGYRNAMRTCAGILFVTAVPLSFFIKPRLPYSANTRTRPLNMRFAASRQFILYQLANVIEATGYFLPSIYLPTYARTTLGTSTFLAALTVILINMGTTGGLIIMGSLSDRLPVTTCTFISAIGASTSVLLIWGLSSSLPALYVFCLLYGLFAGSWASTWTGIMREMSRRGEDQSSESVDPVMVQGHLCVGRGLGNVVSGPLSGLLTKGMSWQGKVIGGYGSGYGVLIVYTGVTAFISGMNILWKHLTVR